MSEIISAIKQICEEKGLSYESVISTIESALAAAYRKDFGEKNQNILVEYNPENNTSLVYDIKTVVENLPEDLAAALRGEMEEEEAIATIKKYSQTVATTDNEEVVDDENVRRFNPKTEIEVREAKMIDSKLNIGDEMKTELPTPDEYGRMAAQTAKQVIIQRLREAERDMVFGEFKDQEGQVVTGVVQRREGRVILVDLGKAMGIILPEDQVKGEYYNHNDRMKVFVKEVRSTPKGPEILLSRTSDEILKKVFYLEIPEVANGLIEIKSVAREAGARSKVAVEATADNIDPIGSCVGQRGSRIQTIIKELGGEKIDIIEYSENPVEYISNALNPAKISAVELKEEDKRALVKVTEDQLSLAIGKSGQNVRLAAYLTGWKIDIVEAKTGEVKVASEEVLDNAPVGKEQDEVVAEEAAEENVPVEEVVEEKVKKVRKPRAKKEVAE